MAWVYASNIGCSDMHRAATCNFICNNKDVLLNMIEREYKCCDSDLVIKGTLILI